VRRAAFSPTPHGEERRSRVSNHEARTVASSFETHRYAVLLRD
jgi:hypothetical protein